MPILYVIGGPNGAGKTTAALELLPNFLNCKEYVNADAIAAGLSPFNVEGVAIQAGRLLLKKIDLGLQTAFAKTVEKYRKEGAAIPVWKDNKVVYISASEIPPAKI